MAEEVERWAREVEAQEMDLWKARGEISAGRREVMEAARAVEAKAREVAERERRMVAAMADTRTKAPERPMERGSGNGALRWWQREMLKTCPFCGGRALEIRGPSHIECLDCGGRKLKGWARGWNRRITKRKPRMVDGVLPCPWCGKYPFVHPNAYKPDHRRQFVECACGGKAPDVATWNQRAEPVAERVWARHWLDGGEAET